MEIAQGLCCWDVSCLLVISLSPSPFLSSSLFPFLPVFGVVVVCMLSVFLGQGFTVRHPLRVDLNSQTPPCLNPKSTEKEDKLGPPCPGG